LVQETQELQELKINKTFFSEILSDPHLRMGFECEFMARNASDLLLDDEGYLPLDFETYNLYSSDFEQVRNGDSDNISDDHNTLLTLTKLGKLFEKYLGLSNGDISIEHSNYEKWKIEVDYSLFPKRTSLENEDNDAGVELVSPVMNFGTGLLMLQKVLNMIQTFKHDDITLYTTVRTALHINLSHPGMLGENFDFAKIAILGGDQYYLDMFSRNRNMYARALLPFVYNELVHTKENPSLVFDSRQGKALDLLRLRGWNAEKVMTDLAALIPMSHYMSIDFHRLSSNNPYIEFRMAGNKFYEKRYDEIYPMIIRIAGLVKIACDPNAYRQEYLKAVYKLVSGVTPRTGEPSAEILPTSKDKKNPFLLVRLYLRPMMNPIVRKKIDNLEMMYFSNTLTSFTSSYIFLSIVRHALELKQANTQRVRHGLIILMTDILRTGPSALLKLLKFQSELQTYGVLIYGDNPNKIILMLTNYIKSLNTHTPIKAIK
jgi:Putative amidoligase enzyme